MKVTFCTFDIPNFVGGPNSWLKRLLPQLRDRGFEIRLLVLTQKHGSPMAAWLLANEFSYDEAEYNNYTEDNIRWIYSKLAKNPPDVFVPHCLTAAFLTSRWIKAMGIPTVGVIHSDDEFHSGILEEFVFGRPEYQVSGLACVSKYLESAVHERNPPQVTVRWLPCGAPLPRGRAAVPKSIFRLVYIGRLEEEQKRISEVTRALCRVVREVPGTEALLYGEGSARPAVEEIIRREGAGLPVKLMGLVESDLIQAELLKCHALVLLSDYEGLPISVMEAMACGVVPICTDMRSGIPELVDNNVTGILVKDKKDDFIMAVWRLRHEDKLWERLSKSACLKIKMEYSDAVCAERWADFLRELLQASQKTLWQPLPRALELPPVNAKMQREDRRTPSTQSRAYHKSRRFLSYLKRRLIKA